MRMQGCGSSNRRRVIWFSILSFVREKKTEKKSVLGLYVLIFVLCLYIYYTGFLSFYFPRNARALEKKCGAAMEEPPQGTAQGPVYHS